jgi:4'-phosphopantetheinyl transferase
MAPWEQAPAHPALGPGEVHVFRLRIARRPGPSVLSPDELARADRFVFERDRVQFTETRAALRRLLAGLLGRDPAAIAFTEGPHGKPRLAGPEGERLRFNVSHTGEVALLAVALDRDVGVDVERHRAETDVDELAAVVCEARELAAMLALQGSARRAAFFALWAGKEAVLKALGSGLSVSPRRLVLPPPPWETRCLVKISGIDGPGFELRPLDAGPGVSAAIACAGEAPAALRRFDLAP